MNILRLHQTGPIGEEIVGVQDTITQIFVSHPVYLIGSALGGNVNSRSRRAAQLGRIRIRSDLELLDGVDRGANDLCRQLLNIFGNRIVVDAVDHEVVLHRVDTMHVEAAGAIEAGAAALAGEPVALHARHDGHQIVPTAQQQGKPIHIIAVDHVSQRRVLCRQLCDLALHVYAGFNLADRHLEILPALLPGLQSDRDRRPGKSKRLHGYIVVTDGKTGEEVASVVIRHPGL